MTKVEGAIAVLGVADVERSVAWYGQVLGFEAQCFPQQPPYVFAILTRDRAEVMLQRVAPNASGPVDPKVWSLYLRLSGAELLQLHARVASSTQVLVGPWRKPYGDAEFEIADPDGHRIVLGEVLPTDIDLPSSSE